MTWLPIEHGSVPERDAILGLKPDVYKILREMLVIAWGIADPQLVDRCRLRVAQMMGARAELAGADAQLLAELHDWRSSSVFTERERAALSFAEQYYVDHHRITDEQKEELARHLSRREVVNFVWALHINEAYARLLTLLDVEPDPPSGPVRPERVPPGDEAATRRAALDASRDAASSDMSAQALRDPEFSEVYATLGRVVVRQALVDEVTSEAVRLHNASRQGCLY